MIVYSIPVNSAAHRAASVAITARALRTQVGGRAHRHRGGDRREERLDVPDPGVRDEVGQAGRDRRLRDRPERAPHPGAVDRPSRAPATPPRGPAPFPCPGRGGGYRSRTLCSAVSMTVSSLPVRTCLARLRVKPSAVLTGTWDGSESA